MSSSFTLLLRTPGKNGVAWDRWTSSKEPYAYSITVRHTQEEDGSRSGARVRDLPDVAEFGMTCHETCELAIDTIKTTAEAQPNQDGRIPEPMMPDDEQTRLITVRVLPRKRASASEMGSLGQGQPHSVSMEYPDNAHVTLDGLTVGGDETGPAGA